jgi:hypothetical protein
MKRAMLVLVAFVLSSSAWAAPLRTEPSTFFYFSARAAQPPSVGNVCEVMLPAISAGQGIKIHSLSVDPSGYGPVTWKIQSFDSNTGYIFEWYRPYVSDIDSAGNTYVAGFWDTNMNLTIPFASVMKVWMLFATNPGIYCEGSRVYMTYEIVRISPTP